MLNKKWCNSANTFVLSTVCKWNYLALIWLWCDSLQAPFIICSLLSVSGAIQWQSLAWTGGAIPPGELQASPVKPFLCVHNHPAGRPISTEDSVSFIYHLDLASRWSIFLFYDLNYTKDEPFHEFIHWNTHIPTPLSPYNQ